MSAIIEQLKDKKIGLALGGGAALGAAHIGILKAFDELEIPISYISGTSIGALIGAFTAFGTNWKQIEEIAEKLEWLDVSKVTLSKFGLLSNRKLEKLLTDRIGSPMFEEAQIPLAMIATDICTGEKVVLKKGSISQAVMASTCVPGVFVPVEIDGVLLVDGGIVENVPISPLKEMGADFIIGVDLNANYVYKKPKNIIDVLANSFHFTIKVATEHQTSGADLLIKPNMSKFSRAQTDGIADMVEAGYSEAMKCLTQRE